MTITHLDGSESFSKAFLSTACSDPMNRILVITPCSPSGLPSQGLFIAQGLRKAGVTLELLTKANSSLGRLLDIAFRGSLLVYQNDVVLVNVYAGRAFVYESLAILCSRLWKRRVIALIHSGCMADFTQRWPRWVNFVLSQTDLNLVPHGFLQQKLSSLGLRIDGVIPNCIDLSRYQFRERNVLTPKLLYLRGTHPFYNPAMALRAFSLIQRVHPDALLTMAGKDGEDASACRRLVQKLNLRNVHFIGQVPNEKISILADNHDIHIHTNRVENMPVSIIEMWACGLPIVGTSVGGMPYLVRNGEDGILVKSEDYNAMAEACLELLSNSALAQALSQNGRRRAEELTWEKIKPLWKQVLLLEDNLAEGSLAK